MKNAINWFEIPVADQKRAVAFYEAVLDQKLQPMPMGDVTFHALPSEGGGVGGALASGVDAKPSADGATLYLNAGEDLQPYLDRVEAAGGKVLLPKTQINEEIGYMAFFMDSEGNRIGFHSQG